MSKRRMSEKKNASGIPHFSVMAGLDPAIHVFFASAPQDVDARHKAGHDEGSDGLTRSCLGLASRRGDHPFKNSPAL
jgi:hypothetical protein